MPVLQSGLIETLSMFETTTGTANTYFHTTRYSRS
jgi:hypothetical protein